jgi:hypothetical protein
MKALYDSVKNFHFLLLYASLIGIIVSNVEPTCIKKVMK